MSEPNGIIGILVAENGHVIATADDFDHSGFGGCALWESQRIRAKTLIAHELVRRTCSDIIVKTMETHDCERIMGKLCRDHGYKLHWHLVGHSDVDRDELRPF